MSEKIRPTLAGKKRHNKEINMEWVYTQIDSGRTVKSVAGDLGVSDTTLRRRHKEYQATIQSQVSPTAEQPLEIDEDVLINFLDSLD